MFRQLFQLFKAVPVTWVMLFVSGLVWAVDNALAQQLKISYHDALIELGAVHPWGLWDGEWWLVFTTAFHHGDVLHLLCNASALWFLGRLLETRLGSWRYAVFCVVAIGVAGVAQTLWSPYVGLSGMLYAQFGLIWVWRRRDTWLQTYVTDSQINFGLLWLWVCVALTWAKLIAIGNVAHFAGCGYGCLVGMVYFGSPRSRMWKPVFLAGHALLIPLFYFVVHPSWDADFHWRRGDLARTAAEKTRHYENAIRCDPNLGGPWVNRAILDFEAGRPQEAWDWILRGLRHNPSYDKAYNLARMIWASFPDGAARAVARQRLQKIFGENAPLWEKELLTEEVALDELVKPQRPRQQSPHKPDEDGGHGDIPDTPFVLPRRALDEIIRPGGKMPAPNPNAPGSAEEGRSA